MRFLYFLIIASCWGLTAQGQSTIHGRVMHDTIPLVGAHVLNMHNNAITTTDANGYFSLSARENSTLKISYVGMQTTFHKVVKADFGFSGILIAMKEDVNQLEGVEVSKYRKITAQDLGILQHKPIERTFAEKRLYSATHSGGGVLSIDLVVNAITGKTKILKKVVANEKNLIVAEYIVAHLSDFMKKDLKLNEEEINVLAYFVMERPDFHDLVRKKDNKPMEFLLIEAWSEYKKLADTSINELEN